MLDNFSAVMIVEGVNEVKTEEEYIEAVQFIIDDNSAWTLQGFFGRIANDFINRGLCHPKE